MLCVSGDWLAGGSVEGSRGSRDGRVKTREDFYEGCFSHSVCLFFTMSLTEGVFEGGGVGT